MTDTLELNADQILPGDRVAALRAEATNRMERAAVLRAQAEDEERAAWRLQGEAAMLERASRPRLRARLRPAVEGYAWLTRNRVILLMERLGIDQPVRDSEGLDRPLQAVESVLGIHHGHAVPTIGLRLAAAERACA